MDALYQDVANSIGITAHPIYEEFTFDRNGRVVFIEAWSDLPGFLPMDGDADPWGEGATTRLATRTPGLGSETSRRGSGGTPTSLSTTWKGATTTAPTRSRRAGATP